MHTMFFCAQSHCTKWYDICQRGLHSFCIPFHKPLPPLPEGRREGGLEGRRALGAACRAQSLAIPSPVGGLSYHLAGESGCESLAAFLKPIGIQVKDMRREAAGRGNKRVR